MIASNWEDIQYITSDFLHIHVVCSMSEVYSMFHDSFKQMCYFLYLVISYKIVTVAHQNVFIWNELFHMPSFFSVVPFIVIQHISTCKP